MVIIFMRLLYIYICIHTAGSSSEKRRKNDSLINLIVAVVYLAGRRVAATFTTAFLEFSVRATNCNLTGVLFGDYIR